MPKPQPVQLSRDQVEEHALEVIRKAKFPFLATMDNDQPCVRPVSPVLVQKFTVYVANLRSYAKTKQIERNSKVELCYLDSDHNQVRITGVAEVLTDKPLMEEIWRKNRLLEHYLGSLDNPELIIYRVVPGRVRFMQEWALEYWDVPL